MRARGTWMWLMIVLAMHGPALHGTSATSTSTSTPQPDACAGLRFTDVTEAAGLGGFVHANGKSAERHLPETMGAGLAWLDFDGDGDLDLYVVQSDRRPAPVGGGSDRLYRNRGDGTFEDVSVRAGLAPLPQGQQVWSSYGQGVTAADVNGDGHVDVYLSNYGPDRLLLGSADGTFRDATREAGLTSADGWSSTALLADADGDGDLDLYVVRYADYALDHGLFCGDPDADGGRGRVDYCHPELFMGSVDLYFRNTGGGRFEPYGEQAGLGRVALRGLGRVALRGLGGIFQDLDGDGAADLYIANDLDLNLLYRNRGDGTFEDVSLLSGSAVNAAGEAEAGMGVAAGSIFGRQSGSQSGSDLPDLLVTHFDVETNTLYRNLGDMQFRDASATSGFGVPSFNRLGFGIGLDDFDLDGDLDVYVANGHILERPARGGVEHAQPDLLLAGIAEGRFAACADPAGEALVGRGLALADFDDDGDTDVALSHNGGPLRLLRNDADPPADRWLGVELRGEGENSQAIGARVTLQLRRGEEELTLRRWIVAGDSYQSSSSPRRRFGWQAGWPSDSLSDWPSDWRPVEIEILWPGGRTTRSTVEATGRYLRFTAASSPDDQE